MTLSIGGSRPQSLTCEPEPIVAPPAPPPRPSRVEHARARERAMAGERGQLEQALFERFSAVPPGGAMKLELKGKANLDVEVSGELELFVERNVDGDFLMRLKQKAGVGVGPEPLSAEANTALAGSWWVRTPEAAADLVETVLKAQSTPDGALNPGTAIKLAIYSAENLTQLEFTTGEKLELSARRDLARVGGELGHEVTCIVDFHRHRLVVEQGVTGELSKRLSMLVSRTGTQLEASLKVRTETQLPREVLEKLAQGQLSLAEVLRQSQTRYQLVLEGEQQGEVVTAWSGLSQVKKLEAEVDLEALARHPLTPEKALRGEVTVFTSLEATGGGLDFSAGNVHLREARYGVTRHELFKRDETPVLLDEVEARRALAP